MKRALTLFLMCCVWMPNALQAQDIHYTQFDRAPLLLNPALTGAFKGTVRVGGLYRAQAFTATPNEYSTPSIYVDAPIIKGFRDRDWVGVGAMLSRDVAGTGQLVNTSFYISGSYHFALDQRGRNFLTLGVQNGSFNRSFREKGDLLFEDEIRQDLNMSPDENDLPGKDEPQGENEWGGGLLYTSKLDEERKLRIGFRVQHLIEPNYSLSTGGGGGYTLPLLWNAHASYDYAYSDRLTLTPAVFYQSQGQATQAVIQARGSYTLDPEKEIDLTGGIGYRFGDAAQLMVGAGWKQLDVSLAFDFTLSPLANATDYYGGIEIAASYIFEIYNEPEIEPTIICPRF